MTFSVERSLFSCHCNDYIPIYYKSVVAMPLHHRPGAMVHSNISISPSSTCQTAMADIFCIDEILRTFLFYCDKPTLARLARTAKVFSDPALDVLWETLESFSYLLKLFPQDLISWIPCDKFPPKPVGITLAGYVIASVFSLKPCLVLLPSVPHRQSIT